MNEKEVKKIAGEWLKSYDCDVYNETKNEWNWPVFTFKGIERPDLLVHKSLEDDKEVWIAVEIKNGDKHDTIMKGFYQVLRQFYSYISRQSTYSISNKHVTIQAFSLATNYSPQGFLYAQEKRYADLAHGDLSLRKKLPWPEAPWPYVLSRAMWKGADQFRKHLQSMVSSPELLPRLDTNKVLIGTLQQHFKKQRPYVLGGPKKGGHLYL